VDRPTIINPPRMDDKELRDRTLAVIDSQYKMYLRKLHTLKKEGLVDKVTITKEVK